LNMERLNYVPISEIRRVKDGVKDPIFLSRILADIFRINTLYMITFSGSGHIGSSFSAMDIVTLLWTKIMRNPNENKVDSDTYFSSKGHDVPGLYALLMGLEKLDFEYINKLRRLDGLPGHPDVETPYIVANTGSLGMGISKARGMAIANRLDKKSGRFYVLTGDGELQEGQIWESLQPAANGNFSEVTVIVDHNKIQSDLEVKNTSDLGDLEAKFKSFGWEVARCDGHNLDALVKVFDRFNKIKDRPQVLIADTVKGKGVSFMEKMGGDGLYKFHSGAPDFETYQKALTEILARVNKGLNDSNQPPMTLVEVGLPEKHSFVNQQKLVSAYSDELLKLSEENKELVVLDADLMLDCGLIPMKEKFPDRYIESGIAEQDMVSVAGGLALRGKLPVVHSFACFLSTRPNEQIYNNATEKKKIIYTGTLAGLLPATPGHSHQSVRDISCLASVPGLHMIQPSNEAETRMAIRWAVNENQESTYLRIVSIACDKLFELPEGYELSPGKGALLRGGRDAVIIGYGPLMLGEAVRASDLLATKGRSLAVINLPWLNKIDEEWLMSAVREFKTIFTLDDHYIDFGQGMFIGNALSKIKSDKKVINFGVREIPRSGHNAEVLKYHGLDYESLAEEISSHLG